MIYLIHIRAKLVFLAILVMLQGCVVIYPVNKTLQPKVDLRLIDEDGRWVEGADVNLISASHPHHAERHRMTITTGFDGVARFPRIKQWRFEAIAVHGTEYFDWSVCVEKEGFKTERFPVDGRVVKKTVVLQAGEASICEKIGSVFIKVSDE